MSKIANLKDRAYLLEQCRSFFKQRSVLEVDCPVCTVAAPVDAHIDIIKTCGGRFLHSSPEYGMKRLLADGIGDIYQISHVFRKGELGHKHNPEFCMAEWYREGFSYQEMIQETLDFIRLFLGDLPSEQMSYRDLFIRYAGIDYLELNEEEILKKIEDLDIATYPGIETEGKDALLNIILGSRIEPQLGADRLFVLSHYPASQAALAKTLIKGNESVAERFEIYYQGMELANGYHELADAQEQLARFEESNQARLSNQKESLPIDHFFLKSLEKGLPECCGVAVGFDRLMMLRNKANHIKEVIPFEWDIA